LRKLKIRITSSTDLFQALDNFKNDCIRYGISNGEQKTLFQKVEVGVNDLAKRGRELSSIGSQFRVKSVIESENCQVVLNVDFGGERPTLISKLRSLLSKG